MEREILFRGKCIAEDLDEDLPQLGDWVYGTYIEGFIISGIVEANDDYITIEKWCSVDQKTVGQYTGRIERPYFASMEKTKIFNGDKVRCFGGIYCQGVWENDNTFVVDSYNWQNLADLDEPEFVEIIGNIYDKEVEHD